MWLAAFLKRFTGSKQRIRTYRRRAARRLIVESLEGRRVLTSGVPFESFDSVFDPALPAGWVSTGTGAWTTVATGSHTANNHAFIPNPSFASSGVLSSAAFTPTAQSSIVNFAHFYNTEANFDGGVLEISIPSVNSGAFQDILVAGGSFITGGYNSTISPTSLSTPLAGRQAWSGNAGGYVATSVQLPPSAIGQNVQLAWRFASDSSVAGVGWRIDSINTFGPGASIDLASLTPTQGRTIFGADANDESGKSVSIVGDVNGDGYDDMLIGAPNAEILGGTLPQGASYLVFGSQTPLATIDLFGEGIVIFDSSGASGRTAAPAGDVNGDGLADFFIGDDRQNANTGASFVVFGKTDWSANTGNIGLNLNSLGTGGIKFTGIDTGDQSGFSVSSAGDVNGDGFDDLLVGARSANTVTNGRTLAGESYLIFGKSDWTANQIVNLATVGQVAGPAGVTFFGSETYDQSGISVSGIGDVNGDGFDDLAIGAFLADGTTTSVRSNSGETAILFGKSNWTGITSIDLATLGSNNGLTIFGVEAEDYSGISVSRVGDLNGDGFDDIAIGAYRADAATNGKGLAGDSYIVFGASSLFGRTSIDLATLGQPNQPTGITIFGADVGDFSGYSISGGGDLNGDGFDDLVIGAKQGDALLNLKSAAGDTYVVFGGPSLPPTIDLATLGANALAIFGANGSDQSGTSVSLGGDVNGDGFDDLLIGANFAASLNNSRSNAGESYLIYGGNGFTNSIPPGNIGTNVDNTIDGTLGAEILVGGDGNDTLQAFTGADVLLGGRGDDILALNVGLTPEFKRIVGGNGVDTLLLAGNPNFLDLTRIPDNRLVDIEVIDIMTGAGSNTLVLNEREVLNISSTTNTLTVIATTNKRVFFESGWTKQPDDAGFQVFTKGAATLRVSVGAPVLVNVIELGNLGSAGSTINGAAAADYAGATVSNAGDVNGDGYDDFIIGSNRADLNGQPNTDNRGKSYVIFGGPSLPATINLLDNLGTAGITITGQAAGDFSGASVSSAGDVNGDGFDDLIIGANGADASGNTKSDAGDSYVIFGAASLPATIDLANLGSAGITIFGADAGDRSGISVSSAGDVNGDGFDDLLIGARLANASGNAKPDAGDSYVIFGAASLPATIDLASLGSAGITIFGADVNDYSGSSVSSAGDVNGDGFDDLIIGANRADASGNAKSSAGDSYVIFGAASLPATIDLASLGSAGITIFGADANDASGISVSSAGDVNGDGFDDLIIGATFADASGNAKSNAGDSYVIFGAASLPATIDLANLGSAGIIFFGADANDQSGISVSGAGDVNGDGFDDLLIGATFADASGNSKSSAGDSYVIFGAASLPATIDLANLGSAGITIFGADAADASGRSVTSAGDVNGDGFDDLLIGAIYADASGNGKSNAGESYVIFGGNGFTNSILPQNIGTSGDDPFINGTLPLFGFDILNGGDGNDQLVGNGGTDILLGGRGDDILRVNDLDFKRLIGGNGTDELRLTGGIFSLNLLNIPDNRIVDIERIEINASSLTLTQREVLNISSTSNTLTVIGTPSGRVGFEPGWTKGADDGGFQVFTKGAATLRVSVGVLVSVTLIELGNLGSAGSAINGAAALDLSGRISNAGDVNGDGYDDFIIGAAGADISGQPNTDNRGKSYVLFGGLSLPATINLLDNLGASVGFTIFGENVDDISGSSVSDAGDVNGDGFDDLVVGARYADPGTPARINAGKSYVIFGGSSLPSTITLSDTLSTTNPGVSGFTILGQATGDNSGRSVSSAGDVNGDGFDDLIVGALFADPGTPARDQAGKSYVIFGGSSLPATITLSDTLSTTNPGVGGFTILGQAANDNSGRDVSGAGDINGDGFDDLIVGTPFADPALLTPAENAAGKSYVIFGGPSLPATITLSDTLSATNPGVGGFTILGQAASDNSGRSVSSAGYVNGDGFDDLIVGARDADPAGLTSPNNRAGKSYVIFGKADWSTTPTITLSDTLSTTNPGVGGFTILGEAADDYSGASVSRAGDVNGDGFDDLIVGAYGADPGRPARSSAGKSYVIFGKSDWSTTPTITLSDTLSTTNPGVGGFTILGQATGDFSGVSVSGAGDVNGDGFDDLIVGAILADPANAGPGNNNAGKSYILYGGNGFTNSIPLTNLGGAGPDSGVATPGGEIVNGADGDDDIAGFGGADVLIGGRGNDILGVSDLSFKRIVGGNGNDTLRLDGSGLALNLLNIADNRIVDIETIDVTGSGNNALTVTQREVLNLSSSTNTLTVIGNAGDQVGFEPGWTKGADSGGFQVFTKGAATLRVSIGVPVSVTLIELGNLGSAGTTINGVDASDISGFSVSNAGDVNGDGYDDFIIGAYGADPGEPVRTLAGKSYVLFGGPSLPATITLSDTLSTTNPGVGGFTILGQAVNDYSGRSVSSAGDVNGDGFDDLIVGAPTADPANAGPGDNRAGKSYIIFGGNGFTNSILPANLGTNAANTINGNAVANILNGADGDDILVGLGGADILLGGRGNDTLAISDLTFRRIVGGNGNNTLRLDGSGQTLNLTTIRDNRILDIEEINITGSGNNTLTLTAREVLNLSSTSNTLLVRRNTGDIVNMGTGWTRVANEIISTVTFEVFTQARATLKIQLVPTVVDFGDPNYIESGSWVTSSITGFNGTTTRFASAANATATWNAPSLTPGYYSVAIWRIPVAGNSTNAQVSIVHNGITEPAQTLNLTTGAAGFFDLGTFFFSGAPGEFVRLSQGTTVANLRVDAVSFIRTATPNATPTITAPTTQSVAGNVPRVFSSANSNAISLSDVDSGVASIQLTISATNGLLTLPSTAGLTFTSGVNGQATFTVRGTLSSLNTALNGLSYQPTLNFSGNASIQLTVNDLGNTGIGGAKSTSSSIALTVSSPIFVVDNTDIGYSESGSWGNSSLTGFNASSTRLSSTAGSFATWNAPSLLPGYYSVAIWKVAVATNSANARVTVAHNGITEPAQIVNFSTGVSGFVVLGTFFFSGAPGEFVRLAQGTPVGILRADAVRFSRVPIANAAPTIVAPTAQAVAGNVPVVFSTANANAISIADIDAGIAAVQLTVTSTNGLVTLPTTTGLTFTSGLNGQATFTVRGTLASLNAALNGASFLPNLNFTGAASVSLTVNDLGNTGLGGALSATRSIALTVASPIFIVDNATPGYSETGTWSASSIAGFIGTSRISSSGSATATWNAPSLAPGYYSVEIWRIAVASNSANARVTIVHNGVTEPAQTVSLRGTSGFVGLGTFFFSGSPGEFVRLSQGTPVGVLRADTVRFTRLPIANAAPTIAAPTTQAVAGNAPVVFSTANANSISVADVDAGNSTVQLTVTATNGLITLPSTAGITFTSGLNGQATFTVRGTLASLNTALNGLSFLPNLNFTGAASISLTVNDLGNTGLGGPLSATRSIALTVASPAFVVDNATPGYVETGTWGASSLAGFIGTSRISSNANAVATWNAPTLAPGYYSVAIWKIAVATNSTNASVTIAHNGITEPAQTVNLAAGSSGFVELGTFFFSGSPGEFVRLAQGTTVGTLRADTVRFTRLPIPNAAPTIAAPTTQAVAGNSPVVFSTSNANAVSVADVDAGNSTVQLTVTATNGLVTLPSTAGLTFTSGLNGQATFTVRGTLASLNTALNGLSFLPNLNFTGAASISLTVNDLGNTGLGGALSATRSIALTVASPTFVVDNATPGYVETGTWGASSLAGFVGTSRISSNANAVATWNAPTLAPGFYSVAIWKIAVATNSTNASVTIAHNGITEPAQTVNLATGSSGFVELGTYFFSGGPGELVRLAQGTTVGTLRADSVRFTKQP